MLYVYVHGLLCGAIYLTARLHDTNYMKNGAFDDELDAVNDAACSRSGV
jgi:hypothetical protein